MMKIVSKNDSKIETSHVDMLALEVTQQGTTASEVVILVDNDESVCDGMFSSCFTGPACQICALSTSDFGDFSPLGLAIGRSLAVLVAGSIPVCPFFL
jgi:hypothetical protein